METPRSHRNSFSSRGALPPRTLVVGVRLGLMSWREMERSAEELGRLVETAGGVVVGRVHQELRRADPATLLGRGRVELLGRRAAEAAADFIAVDEELSPTQQRNVEKATGRLVLDRTAIILDIFARRARSAEGKLQVELAQLRYLAPRLVGRGRMLSQQAGRIGTRGPGETALEIDRRCLRDRIAWLKRGLERVRSHRRIHRLKRESVPVPLVSMVGYTNAGKSTLMNTITGAGLFVEDKLFATLDPTVRRLRLPSGREVLLADTVGFIRRLPHELVESFRSTFEEMAHAELLLHVIDGADGEASAQAEVVGRVLQELGLDRKPRIDVVNKCDLPVAAPYRGEGPCARISAKTGEGVAQLLERVDRMLSDKFLRARLKLPHGRGDILSALYRLGRIRELKHLPDGVLVDCELQRKQFEQYRRFRVGRREGTP